MSNKIRSRAVIVKKLVGVELNPGPNDQLTTRRVQALTAGTVLTTLANMANSYLGRNPGMVVEAGRAARRAVNNLLPAAAPRAVSRRRRRRVNAQPTVSGTGRPQILSSPSPVGAFIPGGSTFSLNTQRGAGGQTVTVMRGHQLFDSVATNGTGNAYWKNSTALYYWVIDPTLFPSPIQNLSKCFMKYRFTKLRFTYCGISPTNLTTGSLVVGYDADGYNNPTSFNPSVILTLADSMVTPYWSSVVFPVKSLDLTKTFYSFGYNTAPADQRDANQGLLYIDNTTIVRDGSGAALLNATLGYMLMDYELELYDMADESILRVHRDARLGIPNTPSQDYREVPVVHEEPSSSSASSPYISLSRGPPSLSRLGTLPR